jgi:hypothetical protein
MKHEGDDECDDEQGADAKRPKALPCRQFPILIAIVFGTVSMAASDLCFEASQSSHASRSSNAPRWRRMCVGMCVAILYL